MSCAVAMLLLAASGCIAAPEVPTQRALYLDLRKIVEIHEDAGWLRDEVRLHAGLEAAMRSLCQVDPESRKALDAWLTTRLQEQGGTPEALYRAHGGSLDAARDALSLTRTRALLRYTEARVGDCPFWLEPKSDFAGQQYDTGHWFLLAETTAFATLIVPHAVPALGGGGRVLVGHGLGSELSLSLGFELAASGTLGKHDGQDIDAIATLAVPVQLRYTHLSSIIDFEVAPLATSSSERKSTPGGRVAIGFGSAGLRPTSTMNYSVLFLAYELHPGPKNFKTEHTISLGLRLGMDWSPR